METPASPAGRILAVLIAVLFVAIMLWAWIGQIDIHAVAQGRIVPTGKVKVIQPFEPAKVTEIHVRNGDKVKAGQLLVELDPTEDEADMTQISRELMATRAEASRLAATIEGAEADKSAKQTNFVPPHGTDPDLVRRQRAVLHAQLNLYHANQSSLVAQIHQREMEQQRIRSSVGEREQFIALMQERVDQQTNLRKKGVGTRTAWLDASAALHDEAATLANERGSLDEAQAAIATLDMQRAELRAQFLAQRTDELAEVERRTDGLVQELIKSQSREARNRLQAPVNGTVQQLVISTIGQVVTTGQQLMVVVPDGVGLEVEAMVLNKDKGFVGAGQEAEVKIEAFPYTKYGTIPGIIKVISNDAVAANSGTAALSANSQTAEGEDPRARTGGGLVFPATISLEQDWINVEGRRIALTSGMAVTVEVKTGQRRVIEYVLTPLLRYANESIRER